MLRKYSDHSSWQQSRSLHKKTGKGGPTHRKYYLQLLKWIVHYFWNFNNLAPLSVCTATSRLLFELVEANAKEPYISPWQEQNTIHVRFCELFVWSSWGGRSVTNGNFSPNIRFHSNISIICNQQPIRHSNINGCHQWHMLRTPVWCPQSVISAQLYHP